ncbi:histidine kinase dimerization/phosphoacceptor domain -containing protein [uncultured Roseobacter sp.]|uniref:sensor histidine kinase n=1 Tax=uncultured Roseobacter sp. TaxID=114847 RepID=UPI00262BB14D|nr:histidine kinase dimerization/phosphoacceptor domain -containing protein [uncultured Roseobacter sp.]
MTGGFLSENIFRGLAFRILLFLSLALLPFGVIAIVQTQEIARQAERSAELSLLGLTEQSSSAERTIIQQAFGTAEALASVIRVAIDDPETCNRFLRRYQQDAEHFSLVGLLSADGAMRCSSARAGDSFRDTAVFQSLPQEPVRTITRHEAGPMTQETVLVLFEPFYSNDRFVGWITLSIPVSRIRSSQGPPLPLSPFDLVIFNASGEVFLSDQGQKSSALNLPQNRSLATLIGEKPVVFSDVNRRDTESVYAVVPIIPGVAYSMSIWQHDDVLQSADQTGRLSIFLPVLMWLASLVVAFWSLNRLAVRHISKLGRQMRLFAFNRALPRKTMGDDVPLELQEIQGTFVSMAESIIRDEAALEDNIRDKNILLKEVHHRVKNNLQLISSIMNLQIRRARSEDARDVLRRLQDRILSLATVHKNLYQSDALDRADAGLLLREIVGQLLVIGLPAGSGVEVTQDYDAVHMDADDAAPLTLLVSEAVTNAMKYIGAPGTDHAATLAVSLKQTEPETAVFSISNSTSGAHGSEGTGLGSQLINAFARQLNGHVEVCFEDNIHRLELTFPVRHRDPGIRDY